MRLVTYERNDGSPPRIGVISGAGIIDLGSDGRLPQTMEEFLALEDDGIKIARHMLEMGSTIPISQTVLRAPLLKPRKFLAIASNYQSHIDEVLRKNPNYEPPVYQRWFNKQTTCINDPYAPILMHHADDELDYEVELALVIGRRCSKVSADEAVDYIAGYMVCNDVSVRNWQRKSPTIMLGKSFDTHGPIGPWIVTADEIGDPHHLAMTCLVNGQVRQKGSTSEMLHNCYQQVSFLSAAFTLEPGDILATGTPAGTGASLTPPGLLKVGDVVRCEIEKIGAIEAVVQAV